MPVYEYKCTKCGYRFEKEQHISDKPVARCPRNGCRGKVVRVLTPPAIVFKGKGFYVNDHGKGNGSGKKSSSSSATSSSPKSSCPTCKPASSSSSE